MRTLAPKLLALGVALSLCSATAMPERVHRLHSRRKPLHRRRLREEGKRPLWRVHVAGGPWTASTFDDSPAGDVTGGDDPFVRYAAVHALGPYSGSVIVVDPHTGRVLTIVNQKLATQAFQPCSTIKLVTAAAALGENIIDPNAPVKTGRRRALTLAEALAHSSNHYFANVGVQLGFDRFLQYARMFGIGETAALDGLDGDPAPLPLAPPPPEKGGMGMMTTFGIGIDVTPLELAALTAAIANGGTLYYLQYPETQEQVQHFAPRVKRQLPIGRYVDDIKAGMLDAVESGTARGSAYGVDTPVLGKTGTCTDDRFATHLGWFASFNQSPSRSIVVVVLLTGGQPVHGGLAANIAGAIYRTLSQGNYFGNKGAELASSAAFHP